MKTTQKPFNLAQLCREAGRDYEVVKGRLRRGWKLEDALSIPVDKKPRRKPKSQRKPDVRRSVRDCRVRTTGKLPEVYEHLQPEPGGVYEAQLVTPRSGVPFAVISVAGSPLIVRANEFEVLEEGT